MSFLKRYNGAIFANWWSFPSQRLLDISDFIESERPILSETKILEVCSTRSGRYKRNNMVITNCVPRRKNGKTENILLGNLLNLVSDLLKPNQKYYTSNYCWNSSLQWENNVIASNFASSIIFKFWYVLFFPVPLTERPPMLTSFFFLSLF